MKNPLSFLVLATGVSVGGSVLAQAPTDVRGLDLWLDAQDGSTITTSGGQVTQWDDKSGNGFHATQGDVARQPTVAGAAMNGFPAIRFDGAVEDLPTNDGMLIGGVSVPRPYTIFTVDQYWGGVQGRTLQTTSGNWLLGKWNGGNAHYAEGWVSAQGSVTAGTNNPAVAMGVGSQFYSRFAVDGRDAGGSGAPGAPAGLQLGVLTVGGGGPFDEASQADVGEVLVYNRTLTNSERDAVSSYLGDKWGVATFQNQNATRTVAFTGGDAGEGLDFSGNFHAAVNATGPGGFTIGDATFTDDTGVITAENTIPGWYPAAFGASAADGNLNTIMQSIRWTLTDGNGADNLTTVVNGLTIGNTYKLQMMFADHIAGNARHWGIDINGDTVVADFAQDSFVGDGAAGDFGVALVHEFVAQSETLDVVFNGTAVTGGDRNPIIQGLTVEDRGVTGVTTTGAISGPGDLDFEGNFVYAIDVRGAGGGTVGDATFTPDSIANVMMGAENQIPAWGDAEYGDTAGDNALESVMESIRWTATSPEEALAVSLDNLVVGDDYKLQLLFKDTGVARGFDVMIDGVLVADDFSTAGPGGVFLTHEFTATSGWLDIMLDGNATTFADKNPILNGLTLERIPEPSALLLGLAGLLGLALGRRRG